MTAPRPKLGRRQNTMQADWNAAWNTLNLFPDAELDRLIEVAVREIQDVTRGKRAAIAWSGGKDSLALQVVAQKAGVHDGVLAVTQLEYPSFTRWLAAHQPDWVKTVNTGQGLLWLRDHPGMLFPTDAATNGKWYRAVQHTGQDLYFQKKALDVLILGRRTAEGNHCGKGGLYVNRRGTLRHSPLRDWPHEAVLHLIKREGLTLPPFYAMRDGWVTGTGPWPQRPYAKDLADGFQQTWDIDPDIVREAATILLQAAQFLHERGLQ